MKKDGKLSITVEKTIELVDSNIESLKQKYRGTFMDREPSLMGDIVAIFLDWSIRPMIVEFDSLEIEPELCLHIGSYDILLFFCDKLVCEWYLSETLAKREVNLPTKEEMSAYEDKYKQLKK